MVKSPGISLPRAPIPSALRLELRRKIDRHQNVTGVSSTCQCEELPMFRGRRRAPAGSRIGAQSEAPSGSDSYCANPTAGVGREADIADRGRARRSWAEGGNRSNVCFRRHSYRRATARSRGSRGKCLDTSTATRVGWTPENHPISLGWSASSPRRDHVFVFAYGFAGQCCNALYGSSLEIDTVSLCIQRCRGRR